MMLWRTTAATGMLGGGVTSKGAAGGSVAATGAAVAGTAFSSRGAASTVGALVEGTSRAAASRSVSWPSGFLFCASFVCVCITAASAAPGGRGAPPAAAAAALSNAAWLDPLVVPPVVHARGRKVTKVSCLLSQGSRRRPPRSCCCAQRSTGNKQVTDVRHAPVVWSPTGRRRRVLSTLPTPVLPVLAWSTSWRAARPRPRPRAGTAPPPRRCCIHLAEEKGLCGGR